MGDDIKQFLAAKKGVFNCLKSLYLRVIRFYSTCIISIKDYS